MWKKSLNIVRSFKVHPKLECMIIQCASERHDAKFPLVYHCLIGSYKPDPFLAKLAVEVGKGSGRPIVNPAVGDFEIFSWGGARGFTTVNEYTVNTFYAYLGWDTDTIGTIMNHINEKAKPPYRRLSVDIKRTADDFLKLARSYKFLPRALELVLNLKVKN